MSNRSKRSTATSDDLTEDSPDEPLETLPLPEKQKGDEANVVGKEKVGYCKPPRNTQWEKGCPSPNPLGRPRKQRTGVLTQMMEEFIEHAGSRGKVTRRETLDLLVRHKAIESGGRWLKFWEQRKEKDRIHRKKNAADEKRSGAAKHVDMVAEQLRQQASYYDTLYAFIMKYFPGVIETERRLLETGEVVRTDEGYRLTDRGRLLSGQQASVDHTDQSSGSAPDL